MRAVIADRAGPPEVFRVVDLRDPEPGPGQVLVAVDVAAITFIDTQLRAGTSLGPSVTFPVILGNGVGGIVVSVGGGVAADWLGMRVVTATGGRGGYATHALAAVDDLHLVPTGLELSTAVAVLADGRTAVGLARAARITADEVVAVTAAAGGVGSLLVQLAVRSGAQVVALAGDSAKLDHALGLGARSAVDYRDPTWRRLLDAAAPDGLDVAFDGVGGDTSAPLFARIRVGGRYLPHGAASGRWGGIDDDAATAAGVTIIPLSVIGAGPGELHALVEEALELARAGVIVPTIGQTFPLEQVAAAHAAMEARTTIGKTLLLV